jgi:hypothetical protein
MQDNMLENNNADTINRSNDTQPTSPKKMNPKIVNRLIKGYIILMALVNIFAAVFLFDTYRDLSTHDDPTLPHWPFLFMSIMVLPALAALYGLWNNKRWGFITYLGITVVSILITFVALKTLPSPGSYGGFTIFLLVFGRRYKNMT